MENYEVEFYEKIDGSCPVAEFLDTLDEKMFAKVARNVDILEKHNINLREPIAKPIEEGIFELRTQFGNNITRIFYFFYVSKKNILTNGFTKKTQKTPRKFIETAIEYKKDFLRRNLK